MPTDVEFHTGVADKVGFACRLLRKAYRRGVRVVVIGPGAVLASLDAQLWTFEDREFVPHLRLTAVTPALAAVAARTPLWLVDGDPPPGAPNVLVNVGSELAFDLARFGRVIEIVSTEPADEQAGRVRWRRYVAAGCGVVHHPAAEAGERLG